MARAGRIPLHPDIAHYAAIAESNRRECVAIDKHYAKLYAKRSAAGAHADTRDKIPRAPDSIHDRAANNPLLRDMLRAMQK
jgi:hypothetical protein